MPSSNNRYVVNHPDGWAVKAGDSGRASGVYDTQAEAIVRAREIIANLGGGELIVQGMDGQFRQKDTVPNGNDSYPPPG